MGRYLEKSGAAPELALCSSALRAQETIQNVAQAFAGGIGAKSERPLYTASAGGMLQSIHATGAEVTQLLVVGHVPAIQELGIALCGGGNPQHRSAMAAGFPSGALATLEFKADDWAGVGLRAGAIRGYTTPAQLPDA